MSSLIKAVKEAADRANQLMDRVTLAHEIESDKLQASIRGANGNIYNALVGKLNDPK